MAALIQAFRYDLIARLSCRQALPVPLYRNPSAASLTQVSLFPVNPMQDNPMPVSPVPLRLFRRLVTSGGLGISSVRLNHNPTRRHHHPMAIQLGDIRLVRSPRVRFPHRHRFSPAPIRRRSIRTPSHRPFSLAVSGPLHPFKPARRWGNPTSLSLDNPTFGIRTLGKRRPVRC